MSIWNGQISLNRYLTGSNLFGPCSGALVSLTLLPELAGWLRHKPRPEDGAIWERACVAVLGKAVPVSKPQQVQGGVLWMHHLLALNDTLRLQYCIDQHPAQVHELSKRRMVVFVPCDDSQLGLGVTAISSAFFFNFLESVYGEPARHLAVPPPDEKIQNWMRQMRAWREWAESHALNLNVRWVAREAVLRGVPYYRPLGSKTLLQLGQGVGQRRLNGPFSDAVNSVALHWSQDKWQTSALFASHGLPTTQARVVTSVEQVLIEARRMGWPVVVKPRSTDKGVGITVNIQDEHTLRRAFELAAKFRTGVLLERYVPGSDYRLLVVGGRYVAAARRMPAQIVGDGRRTVAALIAALNMVRYHGRAPGVYLPLHQIRLDDEAQRALRAAGYSPEDVIPQGITVPLRGNANLSTGGVSEDVTPMVHSDNRELAEQAARLMGLTTAGLDLQMTDVSRSWREVGGAILEINSGPALWVHQPRTSHYDLPKAVLDDLFTNGSNGRVLTAGVTGSLGKTTTCQMLARILEHSGHTVALTGTQGAFIGGRQLRHGDLAGGRAALSMLQDPSVTASVAELARGGLIKHGLGFDSIDVGAVLNVQENHVGLDGVQTREQLARVKQLVVRHASKMAVLNADDPLCLAMARGLQVPVCLVSEQPGRPELQRHLTAGGHVVQLESHQGSEQIVLRAGASVLGRVAVAALPCSSNGAYRPAVANAMFALALAHGLGVEFGLGAGALAAFESSYESNPGRMNFITGLPFRLLLTWADGPQAYAGLAHFVRQGDMPADRTLVFYAVGNRPNEFITASARAVAGAFTRYVCTEMEDDLRGRPAGAVAALLAQGLLEAGVPEQAIAVEPSSDAACRSALTSTPAGALLVLATYRSDRAMAAIRSVWPEAG